MTLDDGYEPTRLFHVVNHRHDQSHGTHLSIMSTVNQQQSTGRTGAPSTVAHDKGTND